MHFKNLHSLLLLLGLSLFLTGLSAPALQAQSLSLSVGTALGKPRPWSGTKKLSFWGGLERNSIFDQDWISVSGFFGYAGYHYRETSTGYWGEETIEFNYHVLTLGSAITLYPMSIIDPERFSMGDKFQPYARLQMAYDIVLVDELFGYIGASKYYIGGVIGARYFFAGPLGVFGEVGKGPAGILGAGLVLKI